jgi:hypothetical protein
MNSVRLAQTEQGSYVLKLLSPVHKALDDNEEKTPFSRSVTQCLNYSLNELYDAANEAKENDNFDAFSNRMEYGVNANLCDSVSVLADAGEGAEFSLSWAATLPSDVPTTKSFFSKNLVPVIQEAAQEFKNNEPEIGISFIGHVIELKRQPKEFDGSATLLLEVKKEMRKIPIEFQADEYEKVIGAFQNKALINIQGDLYHQAGGRYQIRNPRHFSILHGM